jgi:general secretion pathway protein I
MSGERSAGFTLLEVLVALAVLAVSLGALFDAFGGTLRGVERADQMRTATLLARATLAAVGSEIPLETGELDGRYTNGFVWRLQMTPHPGTTEDSLVAAYAVRLIVSWPEGSATRSLRLETLRLLPKGATDGA